MEPSAEKFQKTITDELQVVKDRVRNLIGDANWGEDGRFKEAILKNTIKRFLGSNFSIGTGFIVRATDDRLPKCPDNLHLSKQIDIIVYDNRYPVLFSEGDFIISTPRNVKAIIEVKTSVSGSSWKRIIKKASENGKLVPEKIFNGIFVFDRKETRRFHIPRMRIPKTYECSSRERRYIPKEDEEALRKIPGHKNLRKALKENYKDLWEILNEDCRNLEDIPENRKGHVDHIVVGTDYFIKFWKRDEGEPGSCEFDYYAIYELKGLSSSYFISNLIHSIHKMEVNDRLWFLYPFENGKESRRIGTICLEPD